MYDKSSKINDDQLALVRTALDSNLGNIVRTSSTVVTITIPSSAYDIIEDAEIEFAIPASAYEQ